MKVDAIKYQSELLGRPLGLYDTREEADNAVRSAKQRLGLQGDETEFIVISAAVAGHDPELSVAFAYPVAGLTSSFWERIPELDVNDPRLRGRLYTFDASLYLPGTHWMCAPSRRIAPETVEELTGKNPEDLAALAARYWSGFVTPPKNTLLS